MTFTKSARGSAVEVVAQHQAVVESLATKAYGAGKLVNKGADGGSFVELRNISGTQLTIIKPDAGPIPILNGHVLELGANRQIRAGT